MKFSLTITDATIDELRAILASSATISMTGFDGHDARLAALAAQPVVNIGGTASAETLAKLASMNGAHPGNTEDDNGPANTNAPAVDAAGLPHDVRIHSDNKGLNKDGTWRKRRGAQDAIVAAVEAELKMRGAQMQTPPVQQFQQPQFTPPTNAMPMPAQQFTPPMPDQQYQQPQFTPPMPDQQYQQPQFTPPGPQFQQPQMMPQPTPGYQPGPAALHQPQPMDFNAFMQHLSGQMQKRDAAGLAVIHTDYLANVCQRLTAQFQRQFNSITDIATDPNAINAAVAFINADGRWN